MMSRWGRSLYLNSSEKNSSSNNWLIPCIFSCNAKKFKATIWKRPVLIKGPLGIVSGTELAFLFMFILLLIWVFATSVHNSFATITPQLAAKDGEKM